MKGLTGLTGLRGGTGAPQIQTKDKEEKKMVEKEKEMSPWRDNRTTNIER